MRVVSLHLAFSLLMIHLSLLLLQGHFENNPDHDFNDKPLHTIFPYFPVLKAQDMRNSAVASRSLATKPNQMQQNTSFTPNELDKIISMDLDKTLINDPNHNFSDFSTATNENTGQFRVPTVFECSVSHVSHDDVAPQIASKESMQSGHICWTERKKGKRTFCDR